MARAVPNGVLTVLIVPNGVFTLPVAGRCACPSALGIGPSPPSSTVTPVRWISGRLRTATSPVRVV
jgi:hypothetical protein